MAENISILYLLAKKHNTDLSCKILPLYNIDIVLLVYFFFLHKNHSTEEPITSSACPRRTHQRALFIKYLTDMVIYHLTKKKKAKIFTYQASIGSDAVLKCWLQMR